MSEELTPFQRKLAQRLSESRKALMEPQIIWPKPVDPWKLLAEAIEIERQERRTQ